MGGKNGSSNGWCCNTRLKCWCKWRLWVDYKINNKKNCCNFVSSTFVFLIGCLLVFGSIGVAYTWFFFAPFDHGHHNLHKGVVGCHDDNEGSWSIGVFYGDSPFSLKPIEDMNVWKDEIAAWPVANPVVTCGLVSNAGSPSNFVADPFLYVTGDILYLFYETKNSITSQGDIGVAKSMDSGATWQHLGIALDEDWHLSYPYVFNHNGQIYMMPESGGKGEVRLYRALTFPMQWTLEKIIVKKPLVDSFIINHDGKYWLFGSDQRGFGSKKNGQLEIWYSESPLGNWKPHKKNPIYNTADKSRGARNGGRPFVYKGNIYRIGQDCGETYGRRVRAFQIKVLNVNEFKEAEVELFGLEALNRTKGSNSWNGARYHHLDVQQISSGKWIGVMDGDRVRSGDSNRRFLIGCASFLADAIVVILLGSLLGVVKCIFPLNWFPQYKEKKSNFLRPKYSALSTKLRCFCSALNRVPLFLRGTLLRHSTASGSFILISLCLIGAALACTGVRYMYGGNGAQESYPVKGRYSQFTILTMTFETRLWNLKMFVKHYSRCSSVKEIVVVWNKGKIVPKPSDFDSAVPVRIRVEKRNSLNNRFIIDPLIKTRAVLELDDDIMMPCDDLERGFKVWREHPDRIVGYYPRLIDAAPLQYRGEKYARAHEGYNIVLTGAAFIDAQVAFKRYWSEEAKEGRKLVDKYFNCEDLLMNYLYANASSLGPNVEYIKPLWAIDTSKLSSKAISRNTQVHYQKRSKCLVEFSEMYGSLAGRKLEFSRRKDGWDL